MGSLVFLVWLAAGVRLFAYARWAWAKGYRRGAVGTAVLSFITLAALLLEEFYTWM
ncbi:MAG: hypothetical protein K6U03_08090 [Firmicutes bacterium]|nr:hypothetical protein [Bacillota bacterium]